MLYQLNCLGCHPSPAEDVGAFGTAAPVTGAFYQTDNGRRFFIRMPAPGAAWSADADARLLDEIETWKRACPAIKASAPLIRLRKEGPAR